MKLFSFAEEGNTAVRVAFVGPSAKACVCLGSNKFGAFKTRFGSEIKTHGFHLYRNKNKQNKRQGAKQDKVPLSDIDVDFFLPFYFCVSCCHTTSSLSLRKNG